MIKLQWETKKFKVNELIQLEINPRKVSEVKKKKLLESLDKYNLVEIPAVNTDLKIIGGNQRIIALLLSGRGEELIDVRYPNRTLTIKEVKEYNLISNSHVGEFDLELLMESFSDIDFEEIGLDLNIIEFENSDLFNKSLDQFEKQKESPKETEDKTDKDKLIHFAFSNCYSELKSHGIPFYSLFRNNEMDLEKLKADVKNILPFVYPVVNYFREHKIQKVTLAPKGDRCQLNNFHFVTELIQEVSKIYPLEIFSPFEKVGNKIKKVAEAPVDTYLFDDILTFGTTIKRMNEQLQNKGVIILMCNY